MTQHKKRPRNDELMLKHGGRRGSVCWPAITHTHGRGGGGFNKKYHTCDSVHSVMSVNVFGKQGTKTFELKSANVGIYRLSVLDMDICCQ